jgi:hypothetical protein
VCIFRGVVVGDGGDFCEQQFVVLLASRFCFTRISRCGDLKDILALITFKLKFRGCFGITLSKMYYLQNAFTPKNTPTKLLISSA